VAARDETPPASGGGCPHTAGRHGTHQKGGTKLEKTIATVLVILLAPSFLAYAAGMYSAYDEYLTDQAKKANAKRETTTRRTSRA
jgi:hypothetical protein